MLLTRPVGPEIKLVGPTLVAAALAAVYVLISLPRLDVGWWPLAGILAAASGHEHATAAVSGATPGIVVAAAALVPVLTLALAEIPPRPPAPAPTPPP
ncbi:MAG TPA: hypothetical protein VFN65_10280 [Solirubrobacteraceae bacterium]|nr:hypothetical protein [Solirubrobacteraceae bacterium]